MGKSTERTNAHQDVTAETLTSRFHAAFYNTLIINASKNKAWLRPGKRLQGVSVSRVTPRPLKAYLMTLIFR